MYWGKSLETGETVAVKVIDKKLFVNAYNLKNIQSEIDIMKMVCHENIVKLHDIYQTTNNMYIITEFCEDGDLYHYLDRKKKLPEAEAKKYLKQLMKGAEYLHGNGIIHRDLKPANILIKNGICKLSDFGFAKSLDADNAVMKSIVGTPLYMSPQILKRLKYTAKSDLWSIGLIYYEMLHGRTPWPATNELQLINGIYSRKPTFAREVSELSRDFIRRCLEINEETRMSWSEAFEHDLLRESPKITKKMSREHILDDKENMSMNLTQFKTKYDDSTYIKNVSAKLKRDLSEKAISKLQNLTPVRKRGVKTPTNANRTAGKTGSTKIKSVLAVTPRKGAN